MPDGDFKGGGACRVFWQQLHNKGQEEPPVQTKSSLRTAAELPLINDMKRESFNLQCWKTADSV